MASQRSCMARKRTIYYQAMMDEITGGGIESDDNFDLPKINPYERKYYALLRRCEAIQQSNERIVNRIQHVRKLIRRLQRERRFFMKRLDKYNDNYKSVSYDWNFKVTPVESKAKHVTTQNSSPQPANTNKTDAAVKIPVKKKVKHEKIERDRNAPKRPANPFLLFCQDQRSVVLEKMQKEVKEDVTHQELTKGLANSWNALTSDDKKIYYNMYEKEKERYEKEMQLYTSTINNPAASTLNNTNASNTTTMPTIKSEPPDFTS